MGWGGFRGVFQGEFCHLSFDEVFSGGVGWFSWSFPCTDWNLSREIQGPSILTRVWVLDIN